MKSQRFGDLPTNGEQGVQRRHRVLEDHGDCPAADPPHFVVAFTEHVDAVDQHFAAYDLSSWLRDQAHDRERCHRLSAAGFANESQCLTGP